MTRSDSKNQRIFEALCEHKYYSRPMDRKEIFQASEHEMLTSSRNLQMKLQQNKENFNMRHAQNSNSVRVMLPKESTEENPNRNQ